MTFDRRLFLKAGAAVPLMLASTTAFAKQAFSGTGDWNKWFQGWFARDFGMIGYYADDNAKLLASNARTGVVFLGDSITEGWFDKHPSFFVNGRVDRGIGGQTSSQMVLRMMSDVVDLKPRAVHIMAGTNDVAGNTGPMTAKMTEDNFRMMHDIAKSNGIKVLIASIPPAGAFPWRPGLEVKRPIAELNTWLKQYAHRTGATWVDYWPVLNDGTGAMRQGLAVDGVHPTEAGYAAMEALLMPILKRVLA